MPDDRDARDRAIATALAGVGQMSGDPPGAASMSYEAFCKFTGRRPLETVPSGTCVHFVGHEWHLDDDCDETCVLR